MTEKKDDVLHILRDTLRFHKEMGITTYPDNPDIQRFIAGIDQAGDHGGVGNTSQVAVSAETPGSLDSLETDILACTLCNLAGNSFGRSTGRGKPGSRLMLIGDYSAQPGSFSREVLFGKEEDEMVWKMMAAIELQPDQLYVTNCLKCCPLDPGGIDSECEEKCLSFLGREIADVNPEMICAMGDTAARLVLGKKDPLARLRGRFGGYRLPTGQEIPVMATFHPRFLLQHQEMKKATWNDLQAIKRRLNTP